MKKKYLLIIASLLVIACQAQTMKREILRYGAEGFYLKYTPPDSVKILGVIGYFHGLGEEGNTLEDLLGPNGPEKNEIPKLFKYGKVKPYIVIVPMLKRPSDSWPNSVLFSMLDILDVYKQKGYDIHITGLSLGGIAVHGMAREAYKRYGKGYFKTIGAVCGRVNVPDSVWYAKTYLKLWHGTLDPTLPISTDYKLFNLLNPQYNRAPDVPLDKKQIQCVWYGGKGHNVWSFAYDESVDGYWRWLEAVAPAPEKPKSEKVVETVIVNGRAVVKTDAGNYYEWSVEVVEEDLAVFK